MHGRLLLCTFLVVLILGACIVPKRPPIVVTLGTGYLPMEKNSEDQFAIGQVTIPTHPVGFWLTGRYDFGEGEVGIVQGGIILYFPGEEDPEKEVLKEDPTVVVPE